MAADYRVRNGRRPRNDYGPRKLIAANENGKPVRLYGKGVTRKASNDNPKDESLPRGWSILEPNRIKERRLAAGYLTTHSLAMEIGTMSYQRLHKIENGIVVVRESEYELVATALGIPTASLKLPVLMYSETIKWMETWGKNETIEEGGDHDSVLLAAYVRYHANLKGMRKADICKAAGVPPVSMHHIWHAAKPIDRYSDSTMLAVLKLTGSENWGNVIEDSQVFYEEGYLTEFVEDVQKPRVRYAPEDPDKKAPWTYDLDPFRTKKRKVQFVNAYTAKTRVPSATWIEKMENRRNRTRLLISCRNDLEMLISIAEDEDDPVGILEEHYPHEKSLRNLLANDERARIALLRFLTIRYFRKHPKTPHRPIAKMLGITIERFRQINKWEAAEGVRALIPMKGSNFNPELPEWHEFKHRGRKAA